MMATTEKISTIREILKIAKRPKSTEAFDKLSDKSEESLGKLLAAIKILDAIQNQPN